MDEHGALIRGRVPQRGGAYDGAVTWRMRPPRLRLTALGSGLFAVAAMVLVGALDALLGGSATAYGVLFVLVSALAALWVSAADLPMAPVTAPLAFTAGLLTLLPGAADGPLDAVMSLATALAVHAGWVYGGTLTAGLVVLARWARARRGA